MLTHDSIDSFIASARTRGLSDATTEKYRGDLLAARADISVADPVLATWPIATVEASCAAHLNAHRGVWSANTIKRHLAALRQWGRHVDHPEFLATFKAPVAARPLPHPIPEGVDGVLAMIARTRNPKHKALCALTGLLGLRVGEAIAVTVDDFNLAEGLLTVHGKGSKQRVVPVPASAWQFIQKRYDKTVEEGRQRLVPMSNRGARHAIKRHARNAGISRDVSSHDMRATFATAAYEKGHDLRAVQELLGHASPDTTQVYTGITLNAMRAAADVSGGAA